MPMRGTPMTAADLDAGDVIPVQTEGGSIEPRTVKSAKVHEGSGAILVAFTDGTGWAFVPDSPVLKLEAGP